MERFRRVAAWLAIFALLIDGLLPAAVSAATPAGRATPVAWCSGASGAPLHHEPLPVVPARHCALCGAVIVALLPARGGIATRSEGDAYRFALTSPCIVAAVRLSHATAQPRAPPFGTS